LLQWQNYESGIFDGCNKTNPDIDHNVQLVGYGAESDGTTYWLVR
jgi:cathepsin L